ncbi:2-C-methyl-D-erythritol 4-phosphate cytidylyltransferase [Ruminococcus sp. AF13-28]|jgi:2-C-methyl-D-erythritol 4-phosphate cytidylyltransferase|nr:2-C-methyl-D-erythritol 4-phosphate cytidylyltransferase [Ruminococcus sp. AF13-37]RGW20819.1 2-C-methyl-D-erythritol 4-phosphate cytidylyltransferase [Ruminococcus sp. AF13-28]
MNIAIIFAGGTGQRMNSKTRPKQFLELHGKPILVYTLEQFQEHKKIDKIIVVILKQWKDYTNEIIGKYNLNKVCAIVDGGKTGQESIYNGVVKAQELFQEKDIVLIHDGVRPLIDEDTISKAIDMTKKRGSAITVSPAIETLVLKSNTDMVDEVIPRDKCQLAKAPQCFCLKDLYRAHQLAINDKKVDFIDSASLMKYYGYPLYTIEGKPENIKITTPSDFYIFRAIIDAKENSQIFGL